jgi:hypothetical protein
LVVFTIAALAFYSGTSAPLTELEIDRYIDRIESQTQVPGGRHDLPALRRFLEEDDGEPFYTVNLYEFHDRAQYVGGKADVGTGRDAYDRFSRVMVRLIAERSSHPIFGSDWIDSGTTTWDRIVIVRYRSRRDIAEVFASTEFAEASADKWAALKNNDRLLVQALHIPELHVPVILLAVVLAVLFSRKKHDSIAV